MAEANKKLEKADSGRPKKVELKLVKPTMIRREVKPMNPLAEKRKLEQERQEMSALERKTVAKKELELNKKITELTQLNEKVQASEEKLQKENELVKKDQLFKELEVEKLTQFWTLTRQQLQLEERRTIELEAKMQRLKTIHVEQVSLLHKRISMLQLNTKLEKMICTQTDPFGEDADCTQRKSTSVQTESEWDRAKVHEVLKSHDEQLAELIAEIENAKLQAQTDYKFAVVQMEQGLREEHEEEIRAVKEEKERQLEEMVRIQCEQLQQFEAEKAETKAQLNAEITQLKVELHEVRSELKAKEDETMLLQDRIHQLENQYDSLNDRHKTLNMSYERNKVDQNTLKLEDEKNAYNGAFMGGRQASRRSSDAGSQIQSRAQHFAEITDNIRREHGGMQIR